MAEDIRNYYFYAHEKPAIEVKMTKDITMDLMREIDQAYSSHDPDAIAATFTPDGIFDNASGSEVYGRRYSGRDEIRGYFETLFATTSNVKWAKSDIRIAGHKVYAEWLRTATNADGVEQAWQGMDVYTFEGNLVAKKDTYIKVVLPSA
ncbi:MAG: nuclear transport factor 2 family protein [Rhodospirillaceae bacterium]|nr:nuclear transport factor 2 family protein [Rhodospirillaceae bacterium]